MNFLSHYYLLSDKQNADKVLGNLLPDLMRGFTKIYRQEIKDNPKLKNSAILEGIHFHLSIDKIFHEHDFFLNYCAKVKDTIELKNIPQNRSFIVAHVMVELLIDQYLMEVNVQLADSFYKSLKQSANDNLSEKLNNILNKQNSSKIISIFNGFIQKKYAYALQSDDGIIEALHHIIGKRIGEDFKSPMWQVVIQEVRSDMNTKLPYFLQNLKEAL
jgi:hypothetical protein